MLVSSQLARSAAAISEFLTRPTMVQLLSSRSLRQSQAAAVPSTPVLAIETGNQRAEEAGQLRLVWAICARASLQHNALWPADWPGTRPASVLQQSYWRFKNPQVCTFLWSASDS